MTATTFNPLVTARELQAAGIEAAQAEAIAGAVYQAASVDRADLATKADLLTAIEPLATKAELANTKADLHREIGTLRSEMRWMSGFQAALILAIAAKLFGIV